MSLQSFLGEDTTQAQTPSEAAAEWTEAIAALKAKDRRTRSDVRAALDASPAKLREKAAERAKQPRSVTISPEGQASLTSGLNLLGAVFQVPLFIIGGTIIGAVARKKGRVLGGVIGAAVGTASGIGWLAYKGKSFADTLEPGE